MASSSDESFVWTKASTGSDDSDEMHLTMNNIESDDDIQVKTENQTEKEEKEKYLRDGSKKESKSKKRKCARQSDDLEELDSPKKKKIKIEPESDSDVTRKKKKKHKDVTNGTTDDYCNLEDDNDYLNMKVKEEKEDHESYNDIKRKKSKKQHNKSTDSKDDCDNSAIINDENQIEKKSKKKKKNTKHLNEHEDSLLVSGQENEIDEDVTNISKKSPKKKKHKLNNYEDFSNEQSTEEGISSIKKTLHLMNGNNTENHNGYISADKNITDTEINSNPSTYKEIEYDQHHTNGTFVEDSSYLETNDKMPKYVIPRKPRLSDRIKFEDEIESEAHLDSNMSSQNRDESVSSIFKRYLRENINLNPITRNFNKNTEITDDDEIWILKCPHDVDVNKFNNNDFNLDSKSKIKINGETYCGNIDDSTKCNVMFSTKREFNIKKVVPNGIIHFRKRLPKPHYHEDNVMLNNQTDFIPLPETKCRHPLFGSNYKDIVNIPLKRFRRTDNHGDTSLSSDRKKKKKHKSNMEIEIPYKEIRPKIEYDSEEFHKKAPKVEFNTEVPVKKAKKRKHTNNDDFSGKKSKRIKLEADSADAWESEKAIEEHLFNF